MIDYCLVTVCIHDTKEQCFSFYVYNPWLGQGGVERMGYEFSDYYYSTVEFWME